MNFSILDFAFLTLDRKIIQLPCRTGKPSVLTILNVNFFVILVSSTQYSLIKSKRYTLIAYVHCNIIIIIFVLFWKSFVNTVCISINMQLKQVVVKVEGVLKPSGSLVACTKAVSCSLCFMLCCTHFGSLGAKNRI